MSAIKELTVFGYYHSSATWRIRAVLAMKNIPFKYEPVNLFGGAQHSEEFVKINPMRQVPVLKIVTNDGESHLLNQSMAIIQYIEDNYPDKPLLPKDPLLSAKSRAIAETIVSGIQPLQNLETLKNYTEPLGLEPLNVEQRKDLARYWLTRKLRDLEELVAMTAGKYCVGDQVTLADFTLVPQMHNARRFEADINKFPLLKAIDERLLELDYFKTTGPFTCADAPKNN